MKCPHCGKEIGRAFASAGGRARSAALTDEQKLEIARKGAQGRWKDHVKKDKTRNPK